jgi:hypothetical protein
MSGPIRRSVEVEYWVIDDGGRLTAPGDLTEAAPGVETEFIEPLIEIKTPPCESTAQLRTELFERLETVLRAADRAGKGLVPLSTPLVADDIEDRPTERTRIQDRVVGDDFEYVRHCAGTHLHVEQQPRRATDQLNTLVALDPALALVNSSPYFDGERLTTGARSKLYRWMAYERQPHQGQLWPYVSDKGEWARRLERRYEEFATEAVIAGLDRETVESCFKPETAVWTPVQLREQFSTVEWRSPDTALPTQIVQLADDVVRVVERATERGVEIAGESGSVGSDPVQLPAFDTVRDHVESAINDGLDDRQLRSYLEQMGFDVDTYEPLTDELDCGPRLTGPGAREVRLAYADRLEADIRSTVPLNAD